MDIAAPIALFAVAALVSTVTPGLDTALVLRTTITRGHRQGCFAALGIASGVLAWGTITALGLSEILHRSDAAFEFVRWMGALYLLCLGGAVLWRARSASLHPAADTHIDLSVGKNAWSQGFLTNVLNPKLGLFYFALLPQFVPSTFEYPRLLMILFAAIHSTQALIWFSGVSFAAARMADKLRTPRIVCRLNALFGSVLVACGLQLAREGIK